MNKGKQRSILPQINFQPRCEASNLCFKQRQIIRGRF